MEKRQETLLKKIIREHTRNAAPVSSGLLVERCKLPYSSATIRNEMARLEEEGYIYQPHISAGRVPTAKAYAWYAGQLKPAVKDAQLVTLQQADRGNEQSLKQIAKELAQHSGLAVFWAYHQHNVYYTGISNLLSQPEFADNARVIDISRVIDQMEDIVDELFTSLTEDVTVVVGEENPFGAVCGSVIARYPSSRGGGIFGIIGPLRMDYEKCSSLVNVVRNHLI